MPVKPLFLPTDLARARQILGSWTSRERLSSDEADIISRMIAQGIGEGRSHGLELANGEWLAESKGHAKETKDGPDAKS